MFWLLSLLWLIIFVVFCLLFFMEPSWFDTDKLLHRLGIIALLISSFVVFYFLFKFHYYPLFGKAKGENVSWQIVVAFGGAIFSGVFGLSAASNIAFAEGEKHETKIIGFLKERVTISRLSPGEALESGLFKSLGVLISHQVINAIFAILFLIR